MMPMTEPQSPPKATLLDPSVRGHIDGRLNSDDHKYPTIDAGGIKARIGELKERLNPKLNFRLSKYYQQLLSRNMVGDWTK